MKPSDQNEEGMEQEGHSSSSSHPKGQWERRLQTDIQTAKQALCDALSLHTTPPTHVVPETKPSTSHQPYSHASSSYASSYENISRLMENWMKTPNSHDTNSVGDYSFNNMVNINTPRSSSSEGAHSTTNTTCAQDHVFDLFTFNSSTNYGAPSQTQAPLTMIEDWLFEDGASQSHEDLMSMSLEESTSGLF